ncbi:uncharacterized protein [Phyllobates terribilis]|uniref:uncharacterized protein isoform X2 n=1 Tax=Phyllobates terribilis TaxID=111132 RepID=UPI003CCB2201
MASLGLLLFPLLIQTFAGLEVFAPSPQRGLNGSTVVLPCNFSISKLPLDPKYLAILWSFKGKQILVYDNKGIKMDPRVTFDVEATKDGNASLTLANVTLSDGGSYSCLVVYSPDRIEKDIVLEVQVRPMIVLHEKAVYKESENTLLCEAASFFPRDIEITWTLDEKTQNNSILREPVENKDGTYNVTSSVTFTPTAKTKTLSCIVRHDSLEEPLQEDLQLVYEDRISAGIISACSVLMVVMLIIIIIAGVLWKRKKKRKANGPFKARDIAGPPKLIDGEGAALYCTVDNAPEELCVTWLIRRPGQEQEIQTSQMKEHTEEEESLLDTSYVIKSQVVGRQFSSSLSFIPHMERHKDVTFICRGVSSQHKDEKLFHCKKIYDYIWTPVVEEIQIPRLFVGSPAVLQCNISEYFPDAVTVKWMRRDGDKLHEETDNQGTTSTRASDNTYSRTASLTITPDLRTHQGAEYICLVEHPSLERPIERSTGRLRVYGKPQMSAPIEITMADSSRVQFSLNLQKFYPKDIRISWRWENMNGQYGLSPTAETISTRDDHLTYEVTSVVQIPDHQFRDPEMKIIVEWKHESMETSQTRSLSVRDLPWRPHVGSINVPDLEDGKSATLTCEISGYFLDLLSVFWFLKKDGNMTDLPIKSSNVDRIYNMSRKEKKQTDNTYSCEASVTFTPIISSDQGSEIICRVEHPSEERPIERSTGPLHIGERKKNSDQSTKQIQNSGGLSNWMKKNITLKKTDVGEEADEDTGAEPQEETKILTF